MTDEEFAGLPHPRSTSLPHSAEAEQGLISTVFVDPEEVLSKCAAANIRRETFYYPLHQLVYETFTRMHREGKPIDCSTLAVELQSTGQLEPNGGFNALASLDKAAASTAQTSYFIERLREMELRRQLARIGDSLAEHSRNGVPIETLRDDVLAAANYDAAFRTTENDWSRPRRADDLCENPPVTPPVLIAGVLYLGGTMLISGPSKAQKTFTAFDLGIAIAGGEKWLGFETTQTPVLYLNLELQDFAAADRIHKICAARGHKPPHDLHIWNLRGKRVNIERLAVELPLMLARTGARVVAIDPHYKVSTVSGLEENSNDDQGNLLTALERLCACSDASLIITHHFAKGDASVKNAIDRASGGGVFARWGDVMLTFTPHEEEEAMVVEMALRNFAPVDPFVVRWIYPRWQRDDELDPACFKKQRAGGFKSQISDDDLVAALGDGLMNATEWQKAADVPRATFYRRVKELEKAKRVVFSGNCYRKIRIPTLGSKPERTPEPGLLPEEPAQTPDPQE